MHKLSGLHKPSLNPKAHHKAKHMPPIWRAPGIELLAGSKASSCAQLLLLLLTLSHSPALNNL